ncbi:hypothetical protein [Tengunoibacter tsumagoiensis]|uniref:Uncharacterized protein n=1 Tax=Tengunoibacter tsumagoiensis TaxID=2014871 RepID=A0A401ZWE3_9CHLR|nr:hypothetical protein [Tengunoibacter tsumagoiensis]GCE11177.1 hypothetical protein KTT_10360 [Tengunoibacter tsumagoiensis]
MLITGGLLVVALLAIVGVFLLARDGSDAPQPQSPSIAQTIEEVSEVPTSLETLQQALLPSAEESDSSLAELTHVQKVQEQITALTMEMQSLQMQSRQLEESLNRIEVTLKQLRSQEAFDLSLPQFSPHS